MAAVNIGTTGLSDASQSGYQRKIIKTSDGSLFLFANLGDSTDLRLRYKASYDSGETWGDWQLVYNTYNVDGFDILNENDTLYLILYTGSPAAVRFIKLTYSGGTYSVGSVVDVVTNTYMICSITRRTDGVLWIACTGTSTGTFYTYYSDDDGATWNSGGSILVGSFLRALKIIPKGDNLWVLIQQTGYLKYVEYTTSWGSPVEIAGANSVWTTFNNFSAVKISDTDIWIAAAKYDTTAANRVIKVWHYTGSWDSGTEISNSGTNEDEQPNITVVNNNPIVIWNENNNANINYRVYNGSSWEDIQTLDSTNVFLPAVCESDDTIGYFYWLKGAGSPYTIYFDKVVLFTQKYITSDAKIFASGLKQTITSDARIKSTIDIGTTIDIASNYYTSQRKLIKTSDGNLFLFAYLGDTVDTRLRYKKSTDDGATWSDWVLVFNTTNLLASFDIYNDNDNLYLIRDNYCIKLTYSGGTYSIGTPVQITPSGFSYPSVVKRSNGDICVVFASSSSLMMYYSTDGGDTWNSGGNVTAGYVVYGHKLITIGDDLRVIYNGQGRLRYVDYATSWGTPTPINSDNLDVMGVYNRLSVEKVSDSDIWVVHTKYDATTANRVIKAWHYTGTWDSGTEISESGTNEDIEPAISIVGGRPIVIWNENAKSHINYRIFNGYEWGEIITLQSTDVFLPSACERDDTTGYFYWMRGASSPYTFVFDKVTLFTKYQQVITSDAHIRAIGVQETITSDAHIKGIGLQQTILSDAEISASIRKYITSDAHIKAEDIQQTILSDAIIVNRVKQTILSDANIFAQGMQQTITSDAIICITVLYDIVNKFTSVLSKCYNIINKFSFKQPVIADLYNTITFFKGKLYGVQNDVRTKLLKLYNIQNDIRFYKSWQKPGLAGFQSLGKEYIKVYFDDVEQTDVDIDSIRISRILNGSHTASFEMARPYDSTKPSVESKIEIFYHTWKIYKGYITVVSPSEDPEHILVGCQNKYWKDNRTNKYFYVGHKPSNDKELYYSTIKTALATQFSWNLNLGDFVPEVLNCFANGQSDVLTELITNSGNYGWFHDVNENRKLWTAGSGQTIKIQRQTLGKNIELYQLIEHKFEENIENIVNKLRVQMGHEVISGGKDNNVKYIAVSGGYFQRSLLPAWDRWYEHLSSESSSHYGWDYPEPGEEKQYGEVYKKYRIEYPDPAMEGEDVYPPYIDVHTPSWWGNIFGFPLARITEGFTIDYENGLVTFNEPNVIFKINPITGRAYDIRAPILRLHLFKKIRYTSTGSPSEDPETDIGNPLMFFTDKMGDYPITILKDLNLSSLSVREGRSYYDAEGNLIVITAWDDTDFARDKANWELSKTCDKRITGTINITLDTLCHYGIDLDKRIEIDGITEAPMNIKSIDIDIGNFQVSVKLSNDRAFKRTVSLPYHGE